MKKLMYSVGLGLVLGSGYVLASNNGPYTWDEGGKGALITTGLGIAGLPLTTLQSVAPAYKGEMVYCTTCTTTPVCISTGTSTNQWSSVGNATTICS
jgi:hypothetical protein